MKTHNTQSKELLIPESWDDVSFRQYITYLKKIKPLAFGPSRLRFMDAINGDGAQAIFDTEPDLIIDFGFIHDGPPQLAFPNVLDLGIFPVEIKQPIKFSSEKQLEDFQKLTVDLHAMDDIQRLEQGSKFCALYCQPLINPNYDAEEALKLVENIDDAPVTQVINLYTVIMLHFAAVYIKAIGRENIKNNSNRHLN